MSKRTSIRSTADFSSKTFEARKQWDNILNVLKEKKKKNLSTKNLVSNKAFFQK